MRWMRLSVLTVSVLIFVGWIRLFIGASCPPSLTADICRAVKPGCPQGNQVWAGCPVPVGCRLKDGFLKEQNSCPCRRVAEREAELMVLFRLWCGDVLKDIPNEADHLPRQGYVDLRLHDTAPHQVPTAVVQAHLRLPCERAVGLRLAFLA